jgi:purine nucleosidase/pyrimidine-specific ribonucleoside hydrolase
MKSKILIDTDPGVDDTLALFFALGLEHLDVREVTTCSGNSNIETVSRNARYVLERVGGGKIPVSQGARRPLAQEPIVAVVHGEGGLGRVVIPERWQPAQQVSATSLEAMVRFLSDRGEEPRTIVALAPLTNVAELIAKHPMALRSYDRLVILGGTHKGPGNKGPVAEFNFRCDPEAADLVLERCPCPITLVPLDLCMRNVLSLDDLARIEDSPLRAFLEDLCRDYAVANEAEEGILMYDPLAIFCAAHPECFSFEKIWMRVDTGASFARGMSVVDRRVRSDLPKNVSVATDVKWEVFVESFFAALGRIRYSDL